MMQNQNQKTTAQSTAMEQNNLVTIKDWLSFKKKT